MEIKAISNIDDEAKGDIEQSRGLLGSIFVRGEDVEKKVKCLSGGKEPV